MIPDGAFRFVEGPRQLGGRGGTLKDEIEYGEAGAVGQGPQLAGVVEIQCLGELVVRGSEPLRFDCGSQSD